LDGTEKKTTVASFRLPDALLEKLRNEAASERISLNVLVNQVLDRHTEWDIYAQKLGMLSMGKGIYKALLESTDEHLLMEKGKLAGLKMRDFLLFKYKRADLESFLDLINNMKREFGIGEIEVSRNGRGVMLVLHHDFGRSHSIFFASIADTAIQSLTGLKPKLQLTDDSIVAEFAVSPSPLSS
jgi:hypothetical protein